MNAKAVASQVIDALFPVVTDTPSKTPSFQFVIPPPSPADEMAAMEAREAMKRGEYQTTDEIVRELRIEMVAKILEGSI